jgi:CHAT domain-containing protein
MRPLAVAALLILGACGPGSRPPAQPRSLDEEFRAANDLLRKESYAASLTIAEAALKRAETGGDPVTKWRFRLLKAQILVGRRDKDALPYLDSLGMPPPAVAWDEQRARLLLLRTQALYLLGRWDDVQRLLPQAAAAAEEAHSALLSAEVELRRGALLVARSQFSAARSAFQNTLKEAERQHDDYLGSLAANYIGYALLQESRYDEAIPWFERARAYSAQLGAADSVARADGNIGASYAGLGDYENARLHYDRALAAFDRTGNLYEQQIWLGHAGNLFFYQEKYAEAADQYTRALAIARSLGDRKRTGIWVSNLASASIELAKWDTARKYYEEARQEKGGDKNHESYLLKIAAQIAAGENRSDEAVRLYREVLKSEPDDPTIALDAHAGLARLYVRNHQLASAGNEFRAATETIDRRGAKLDDDYRLSFLSSLIRFNREYVDFEMARHEPEEALEVAEASRSRVLAGRSGSLQTAKPRSASEYRQIARRTGSVLLEYWFGDARSYLWVITADRIDCHTLAPRSVIRSLVENWRAVIASGRNPLEVARDTGDRLYTELLSPIATDAPGRSRFIIVPDEDLYSLNFESLPAGAGSAKFWIEQATTAIAPSLNYLTAAALKPAHGKTATGKTKMLLIGDPESTDPQFPKLEFAGRELDSIAGTMAAPGSKVLRGSEARPESYASVSPAQFGFIHFSAHATANPISPLDSSVILSGPPDQCRLRAHDVMKIPLKAELVTVSGCRSAGGKTYSGEGLVGFAWAFLKAGADNVIAGLWDVNDRSTMELMSRLYSEIAAGADIPDALRASKLALIHEGGAYRKPFYWAPFELYTARD